MPRDPENAQVFELGYYEQMQIDMALQTLLNLIKIRMVEVELIDVDTLKELSPIFSGKATITIIRKGED